MPSKVKNKDFEPKVRNKISLGSDSNIDNDFKAFKIGDIPTGLEFKIGAIRSTAEEFITKKETTEQLTVTTIRGNVGGTNTEPQFIFQKPDETNPSAGLWFNCFGETGNLIRSAGTTGHLHLEADGTQYQYMGDHADNSFQWMFGDAVSGTQIMSLEHEGELKLYSTADSGDYFSIAVGSAGATTITTVDNAASAAHLIFDVDGQIELNADQNGIYFKDDTVTLAWLTKHPGGISFFIYDDATTSDFLKFEVIANSATTISTTDNDGALGHLTLLPDGDLILDPASQKVIINATDKLYLDGGTDTYIESDGPDRIVFTCGDDTILLMKEATTGNYADFLTTGVGFTQFEPTYNATDTNVNFNDNGNKGFVTFGSGNITDLNLYFPNVSCNCTLLVKQDGSGSRTITNYKTFDQADGNESTVVWSGGSNPTLTTTANKLDILSFYWDNDNHKAYGVASLNF